MSKRGYIYIIEKGLNLCKIGITKNFPKLRNEKLSVEHEQKLKVRGYCIVEDINKNEKLIHKILDDFRVSGEWFSLSYEKIVEFLRKIFKFQEYDEKNIPAIGYGNKTTLYLTEKLFKAFNDIYAKRMLEDRKTDKSALICEAIELLVEKEKMKNI